MSRSGLYEDDGDPENCLALGRWRGQVASAVRGKRGQAFFREMVAALDAMPEKRLIAHELVQEGSVCAIGSVGAARGVDMQKMDPHDYRSLAETFGVAAQLVQEVEWINDEWGDGGETPETRWQRMRDWAAKQIAVPDSAS